MGSVDDLIELNSTKIEECMSLARLIYARAKVSAEHKKASSLISFTKGKQPSFADENDGMPYLTIGAIENGTFYNKIENARFHRHFSSIPCLYLHHIDRSENARNMKNPGFAQIGKFSKSSVLIDVFQ